jgi:protein O-GlcNAc transferase
MPAVTLSLSEVFKRAAATYDGGRYDETERLCRAILGVEPDNFDATYFLAMTQYRRGRRAGALANYDKALAIRSDHIDALNNRAVILQELGRFEEALEGFDKILAVRPDDTNALNNRGMTFQKLGRLTEALASFDDTLAVAPDHGHALNNRGVLLKDLKRFDEALSSLDRALMLRPDDVEAINNRGIVFTELRRFDEALAEYDRALVLEPNYAVAHNNRGNVLKDLGRLDDAIASYDRALAIRPDYVDALNHRANVLMLMKRYGEALAGYQKALACDPSDRRALGGLASCAVAVCDFQSHDRLADKVRRHVADDKAIVMPFDMLFYSDNPALQLACARRRIRDWVPVPLPPVWRGETWRNDRIRLAYVSSDFRQHPVAALMTELIECHDRSRFEVIGMSLGRDDGSAMRARLIRAFDRFHDVRTVSDLDVARLLHDLRADIVIDLAGYTLDCRPQIFAHRPAPISVGYLGFPATMGTDFIDYILADKVILPSDQQQFFPEKIVHLPDSYQVNQSRRHVAEATPTRRQAGLPEAGFVFCCFNNHTKLAAPVFDVWMRLLHAVGGSVLWLTQAPDVAVANLRREAAARGIDPDRLIFAPKTLRVEDHFARHRLADLFLDTLPYNAHTTASDALWTGLPVLTCRGNALAGRVAASLIEAVGLPELVTENLEEYQALALRLAADQALLAAIKAKLERNRLTYPLFDTDRFRRHIEIAYRTMWDIWQRGEPPQSFAVA